MSNALLCLVLGSCLAQTSQPTATQPLPAEWPPLPGFVHPVDYLKWFEEVSRVDPDQDAWPLWRDLNTGPWSNLSEREDNWLWGVVSEDRWIPGLFTGIKMYTPDQYPWDPKDHWDWEEAFELQQASGLAEKIRAAAQRPSISWPVTSFASSPDGQDWGFTGHDHLLVNALFPSLANHRTAAKVLLQNAWRAPGGRLDPAAMLDAVETSLRIAEQLRTRPEKLCILVNDSLRGMAYENILAALHHGLFNSDQLIRLDRILTQLDAQSVSSEVPDVAEIAILFEILQLAYAQVAETWELPPKLNEINWAKLEKLARVWNRTVDDKLPVDMRSQAGGCEAWTAIRQIMQWHLETRRIWSQESAAKAIGSIRKLGKDFHEDPNVHVLLRCFADPLPEVMLQLNAQAEATRRAVHLLVALHQVHDRTGAWPRHLRQMKSVLDPVLLIDPFSRREFIYRIENDHPLLYSVGLNGVDDGGVHDRRWGASTSVEGNQLKNADFIIWPIQGLGTP